MRVYCDFDGTISTRDTTDFVLSRLASPAWTDVEAAWIQGTISAAECMRRQIEMIRASHAALQATLEEVDLQAGFPQFVAWCEYNDVPLVILSDGVDAFIRHILARYGFDRLPVIANRLVARDADTWSLEHPRFQVDCCVGAGVCKCACIAQGGHQPTTVYIGDGRSDFCASARADIVFAKSDLAAFRRAQALPFYPFDTFDDVVERLAGAAFDPAQAPLLIPAL